jgi:predicted transcriptional regulator
VKIGVNRGRKSKFAIRELRICLYLCCNQSWKMKKHSGMRPHDIVILLKIASKKEQPWLMKDLAVELGISASEVSESLNRSAIAGLISKDKKRIMKLAILDFLQHGLRHVYPQIPGAKARGLPTAHAAPPLASEIASSEPYVWPYGEGTVRGESIEPLHPKVPEACLKDPLFYEYMALCDALRVGRAREKNLAIEELKKRLC